MATYLDYINALNDRLERGRLTDKSVVLYLHLLRRFNDVFWAYEWMQVDNRRLMADIGTSSEHTLIRNRSILIDNGLVQYKSGRKGQPGKYKLLLSESAGNTAVKTAVNVAVKTAVKTADIKRYKTKTKMVDYQRIINYYNETCVNLPRCTKLSEARKAAIRARLSGGYSEDDLKRIFEIAHSSAFLNGDNARGWRADFDWLLKDANAAKVLDGNYTDRRPAGQRRERTSGNIFLDMLEEETDDKD